MNHTQISFESEKLTVDWISFKFQHLENIQEIAQYLFNIGFNSYRQSGKLVKPFQEAILVNPDNQFKALFVSEGPYWKGVSVIFLVPMQLFFTVLLNKI